MSHSGTRVPLPVAMDWLQITHSVWADHQRDHLEAGTEPCMECDRLQFAADKAADDYGTANNPLRD